MQILLTKAQRVLNDINEVDARHTVIDMIKIEQLHDFTVAMINAYGTEEKFIEANKVGDVVIQMLIHKNLVNEHTQQSFVDILLSAVLMHNIFYDPSNFTTLYEARRILGPHAKEAEVPQQAQDAIFQTIEAQLGEDTPVPGSRPAPNSPTELVSWAIWFVKEFKPQV